MERRSIALVCDFFHPRLGGVENHIWSLASQLVRLGHKVIIITHAYNNANSGTKRVGVRYLEGPLKVYYCPILPFTDEDTLPTFLVSFPLIRWILIREAIDIVHAHQATSTLANESIVYASELGLWSVYTDHSLFGFNDIASLVLNKVLSTTLSTVDAVICVSNTCRENFILRTALNPNIVHVIPNAIDASKFTPDLSQRCATDNRIRVVVVSRLVYRKGVDLLVGIIPRICQYFPQVDFIIGGDGSKRVAVEEMVEREQLQDRVEFLGAVPHNKVRDVLVRGHVFLNCSLTESFCIALLEAASCGLYSVSTNVGGVPEVLPSDMIHLADPKVSSLVEALKNAISDKIIQGVNPVEFHYRVQTMYSWTKVANRTVHIYDDVIKHRHRPLSLMQRLARYYTIGDHRSNISFSGMVACFCAITIHCWATIVEWWQPRNFIDVVPDLLPETSTF